MQPIESSLTNPLHSSSSSVPDDPTTGSNNHTNKEDKEGADDSGTPEHKTDSGDVVPLTTTADDDRPSEHLNVRIHETATGRCPFLHGTVDVQPYPGYPHGTHPEICPRGCKPEADPGGDETIEQRLLREALEFQNLYHKEFGLDDATKTNRMAAIQAEVADTGTYTHTFDELQHGFRVAWRVCHRTNHGRNVCLLCVH